MNKPNYIPNCIDISLIDKSDDIFSKKQTISFSNGQDFPLAKYGFQHFIHSIKNDTEKLKQFENKKKVYQIMNPFERYIFDYNKSIGEISLEYFDLKSKPNILSRDFYKLWEMIFMLDLIDINQDNFISTHLAEESGSFIQATMFYRDMFTKKSKNDKYIIIPTQPTDVNGHKTELDQKFIDYYSKEKPVRIIKHQLSNKKDGILDLSLKDKVDLITANGAFEWVNENIQEQTYFKQLFSQIVTAINIQKKDGNFVCKFFETFTTTSLKFLEILRSLYKNVYIIKPLTSRPSNAEKYAVCINFKYSDKDKKLTDITNTLNNLYKQVYQNNKLNIVEIFQEFNFDNDFLSKMIQINRIITNNQFKAIGEILTFVDSQNYFGDTYKDKREEQIKAAEYWTKLFFMNDKDYKKNKTDIQEIMNKVIKNNLDKAAELKKILIF